MDLTRLYQKSILSNYDLILVRTPTKADGSKVLCSND